MIIVIIHTPAKEEERRIINAKIIKNTIHHSINDTVLVAAAQIRGLKMTWRLGGAHHGKSYRKMRSTNIT